MGGRRLRYRWRHRSYDGYLQLPSQSLRPVAYTNCDRNGNSGCKRYAYGDSHRDGNGYCNTDAYSYYTSKGHSDAETSADSAPAAVAGNGFVKRELAR